MSEPITAWQCIGCGRLEAPAPCIGVCRDRKVELVDVAELANARVQVTLLRALVRRLAITTPHADAWEQSFRALQADARALLCATDPDQ